MVKVCELDLNSEQNISLYKKVKTLVYENETLHGV